MAQLDLLNTNDRPFSASVNTALPHLLPLENTMLHIPHEPTSAKADGAYKTISEVSEELDVPTHVLRFWESRFPQVKPQRMRGGRRYYPPSDAEVLKKIKTLLYSQGYTIKGAKKHVKDKTHEINTQPLPVQEVVKTMKPVVAPMMQEAKPAPVAVMAPVTVAPEPVLPAPVALAPSAPKKRLPAELAALLQELRDLKVRLAAFA